MVGGGRHQGRRKLTGVGHWLENGSRTGVSGGRGRGGAGGGGCGRLGPCSTYPECGHKQDKRAFECASLLLCM